MKIERNHKYSSGCVTVDTEHDDDENEYVFSIYIGSIYETKAKGAKKQIQDVIDHLTNIMDNIEGDWLND